MDLILVSQAEKKNKVQTLPIPRKNTQNFFVKYGRDGTERLLDFMVFYPAPIQHPFESKALHMSQSLPGGRSQKKNPKGPPQVQMPSESQSRV